jgi:hypothetical protein
MAASEPELRTEQEIIGRFQEMRRQMQGLVTNLNTLEAGMSWFFMMGLN